MSVRLRSIAFFLCVGAVMAPVSAQQKVTLESVLDNATRYVAAFIPRLANLVAVETYEQRLTVVTLRTPVVPQNGANSTFDLGEGRRIKQETVRRLTSDFMLVRFDTASQDWVVFRDVATVDGKAIDRPANRLVALFTTPGIDALARAAAITVDGARFQLPGSHPIVTNPLLGVALLQPHYRHRFTFSLGGEDRHSGPGVRLIRFEEREFGQSPSGVKEKWPPFSGIENGRLSGSLSVHVTTGRVLKTLVRVGALGGSSIMTTFRAETRLGHDVLDEMRTGWIYQGGTVAGTAKYSDFRSFGVSVDTPAVGKVLP